MKFRYLLSLLLSAVAFSSLSGMNHGDIHSLKAEESVIDEAFARENFLNPDNYKYDTKPVVVEDGIKLSGSTTYLKPFSFDRGYSKKIKFKFNIDEMNDNEVAYILFSPDPEVGFADINMSAVGVYFTITKMATSYRLDGYYTDGLNYTGQALTLNKIMQGSVIRDHTLQLETSLVSGYTDGIRLFYNGEQFADWLCYSMVKNNVITDSNGRIYISVHGKIRVTNIVPGDTDGPRIDYEESESKAYAGDEYTFGNISSYDEIDGYLPWTYRLYDPNGNEITNKITVNNEGNLVFKPLKVGEHTLRVLSSDYSTNSAAKRILLNVLRHEHYPVFDEDYIFPKDARTSTEYIIPQVSAHDIDSGNEDNDISYAYDVYYYADSGLKRNVELKQKEDGAYYFLPKKESAYLSDGIGKYYINVTATNSYGSTVLEREIYVKPDVVGEEAVKSANYLNEDNWALSSYNTFDQSIHLAGPTYYKAGLNLEKGIFIYFNVDQLIDKSTIDNWFSFGFSTHPGNGKYGSFSQGLYFMFFYQNGAFRYNMQYVTEEKVAIDIKNNEPLAVNFEGETSLAIYPFDVSLDPSMYDNIDVSLNGGKVDSFEIYKIARSEMMDDEGFVYLNYSYSNDREETTFDPFETNNPMVSLNRIRFADVTAPTLTIEGDIPTVGKVGDKITFPTAKAVDETDGEVEAYLSSIVDASGVGITVINNTATFSSPGEYKVYYKATDLSGNVATFVSTITIEGGSGCGGSLAGGLFASLTALCISIFVVRRRYKEHE